MLWLRDDRLYIGVSEVVVQSVSFLLTRPSVMTGAWALLQLFLTIVLQAAVLPILTVA